MTATIKTNVQTFNSIKNEEERRIQYLEAINFYLRNTDCKIVFCENSDTDISYLLNPIFKDRIEFLKFKAEGYVKFEHAKSIGEAKIIKYALENSKFIENTTFIIKVTGRVKIENINEIINKLKTNPNELLIELRSNTWAMTVCFASSKILLKNIINDYLNKNFSNIETIEEHFAKIIYLKCIAINAIFPIINGINGMYNKPYKNPSIYYRKTNHYLVIAKIFKLNKKFNKAIFYFIECKFYRIQRILERIVEILLKR